MTLRSYYFWQVHFIALLTGAQDDGQCSAGEGGCPSLPVYPACEYSCNERLYIGPDSGNTEAIWPPCPDGPGGCKNCEDRNPSCPGFASSYNGLGCEDNPSFMIDVCAKSCNTCHLRDMKVRCADLENYPDALLPGTLNETFNRLVSIPGLDVKVLSRDPWILHLPSFLDDEETDYLLNTKAFGLDWKEASDTGALDQYGRAQKVFSTHRSTGVIWCNHKCHNHPIGKRVRAKISEMVRVHPHNFESFQFLRYTEGQYYKSHHDSAHISRKTDAAKHRVYTFFLYLNDVEGGGETAFPQLGLKVKPSRGAAILWPSVTSEDPWVADMRTSHEALPVISGVKYSMNIWVHQGPYTLAHDIACSGSPID